MSRIIDELKRTDHKRYLGGLDFFKYIGPGLLVTVGFIDPGNWASNFAAGFRIWLRVVVGGDLVYHYVDCVAAQCGPPGHCDGIVPE